jgi:mannosyl-oligosaccharide alpha-1,2-mannosidase
LEKLQRTQSLQDLDPLEKVAMERRQAIKEAFGHAWKGYKRYAWGHDELRPVSNKWNDDWGGFAVTILDSLDTLLIMELEDEFKEAKNFVASLNFEKDYGASVFETTIRHLGGLIAAYQLSGDEIFLTKAKELADRLLPAFNTTTGIPHSTVNLKTGIAWSPNWSGGSAFLAEFGSLHLEFEALTFHMGDSKYVDKVDRINKVILRVNTSQWDGLFPTAFHPHSGVFTNQHLTFGSRGDSFYEILLKQWLHSGKRNNAIKAVYDTAIEGMRKRLLRKSKNGKLMYIAEQNGDSLLHKMDHLVCFVPGMLALDGDSSHLELAKELIYTCYQLYSQNPTGRISNSFIVPKKEVNLSK